PSPKPSFAPPSAKEPVLPRQGYRSHRDLASAPGSLSAPVYQVLATHREQDLGTIRPECLRSGERVTCDAEPDRCPLDHIARDRLLRPDVHPGGREDPRAREDDVRSPAVRPRRAGWR